MERGIYCHNWGHEMHNMHPSMPIHSKSLIDILKKLRGTMVCWAAMGGGSISLPYLEHEANGQVPPRMLYHGYMNDADYIKQCKEAGLDVFAVFYEAQGWEIPVVLSEDGKSFKQMNVIDEKQEHDWYGLTEFTQDKHWQVFGREFSDYFPDGLINSDGEKVTDLFTECVTRDVHGNPIHTKWVEIKSLKQKSYLMCRNNPVWAKYMNKAIEIMIDNGARGIQLDETETPIASYRYGGCFCKDCMKQFNADLEKRRDRLPEEFKDVDFRSFNYGKYLEAMGVQTSEEIANAPLFDLYWEFMIRSNNQALEEMLAEARDYACSKGVKIRISGNIFNLYLYNYPSWDKLDLMVTELDNTLFKRHDWFRYAAGVTGDMPVIVAENPYGGMIPAFQKQLKNGKAYDLFRIFLLEAAIHGINMCVPYGGWMGNEIPDAFFPPLDVAVQVQNFLADNEELISRKSGANVKIFYSFPSYMSREPSSLFCTKLVYDSPEDLLSYRMEMQDDAYVRMNFWEAISKLQQNKVNYDTGLLPDGDLVQDKFSEQELKGYELIILPGCSIMTQKQADVIEKYAMDGGKVLLYGDAACNLDGWQKRVCEIPTVTFIGEGNKVSEGSKEFEKVFSEIYTDHRQINWDADDVYMQCAVKGGRTIIHGLNYRYNMASDKVESIEKLTIKYKSDALPRSIQTRTLDGTQLKLSYKKEGDWLVIELSDMPVYTALVLEY